MAKVGRLVKETIINELSTQLGAQPNFFVTRVNRLTSTDADALRQTLFGSQASLVMIKRKLGKRAAEGLKIPGLVDLFEGSVGIVIPGEDVLPVAKVIVDFIKTHEEQLAVRGGFIEGTLLDKQRVEHLASLPSKPVLLAQIVFTIEAPIADLIFTIERLVGDLMWAVEQAATKKLLPAAKDEGQTGAAAPAAAAEAPATEPGAPGSARGGEGSAAGGVSPRPASPAQPEPPAAPAASTTPPAPETSGGEAPPAQPSTS